LLCEATSGPTLRERIRADRTSKTPGQPGVALRERIQADKGLDTTHIPGMAGVNLTTMELTRREMSQYTQQLMDAFTGEESVS